MIEIMSNALFEQLFVMTHRRKTLVGDDYLFHRDDPVISLFLVVDGVIELIRPQADGRPIVLQRAERNGILAEASLYSGHYHCDAVATAPSVVAVLSRADVLARLRHDTDFSDLWSSHLAAEMQQARYRSEILTRKTVAQRLDAWLAWRGDGQPKKGEWKRVAAEIGVSPEALYRELSKRR